MTKLHIILILLFLCACSVVQAQPAPTLTSNMTLTATASMPIPTATRELRTIADATPTHSDECTASTNRQIRQQHTVWADIDYASHTVSVRQIIDYQNQDATPLAELVLNIDANYWHEAFSLTGITTFATALTYTLDAEHLTVALPDMLLPGCNMRLEITYTLNVPALGAGVDAYKGYFSYSQHQLNLGHWIPSVAVRRNSQWVTHDSSFIGEQTTLEVADWDVTLAVYNAPDTLKVAAPGEITQLETNQWRYVHNSARDFTVSLSDSFLLNSLQTVTGVDVELYSLPDAQISADDGHIIDAAAHALSSAQRALSMYEDLFGNYTHSRMIVVEAAFPDGMEFDGLVFVSADWFRTFTGDPASYLTLITVHEVAHQWWYARVGNDSALNPYLDEALATYSEYVFVEEYYPQLRQWWWEFRVDPYPANGNVDSTVYQFSTIREYINAVYLQGVRMLHQLRQDLGTQAFFDWLRAYAEAENGRIASPREFWSLLTPDQLLATQATREEYLVVPQIEDMP